MTPPWSLPRFGPEVADARNIFARAKGGKSWPVYAYADNNPVNRTDSDGLDPFDGNSGISIDGWDTSVWGGMYSQANTSDEYDSLLSTTLTWNSYKPAQTWTVFMITYRSRPPTKLLNTVSRRSA